MIKTIIKKELRGYVTSGIALLALAAFLAATLYVVFWHDKLLARGMADVRPMFAWLPTLLLVLVAVLIMRMWADERRTGTIEILLTLPVERWQLVAGKFLGAMAIVAVALVLTLGLPLTIAHTGRLDWGPVIGGYLASLLLAAVYLAIGMCVSIATQHQAIAALALVLIRLAGVAVGNALGDSGAAAKYLRFDDVARGVIDLRDLALYLGIVASALALNVVLLKRVTWSHGEAGRSRRRSAMIAVGLVAANALALVVWLAPVRRARIDLTADGAYSLSAATAKTLKGLDERLLIRAYFSAKTHPKLEPLVPQIRDLLDEYAAVNPGKVRVEFVDPTDSDVAKREAKERFGIDPTPLRFASQTEKSVINAYFAIALEYGDQHAVIGLEDLIKVRVLDIGEIEISLGNLEYQLTKSIKKAIAEFASVDTLFASTPGTIKLTAYITPKTLPDNLKDAPTKLQKVVDELSKQAGGKLAYTTVEPKTEDEMKQLFATYGLRPYSDLLGGQVYYFHMILQVGDRVARIVPPQNVSEAELKATLTEGLKRAAPGFTRVIGLWQPQAGMSPPMEGMPPQQMPPPQAFRTLEHALEGNYEVRSVALTAPVPDDIETLVLAGPANLDAKAVEAVDQFVMRGGALVVLAGRYRLALGASLAVEKVTTGLEALFGKWGITLGDELVYDTKNDSFPVPVQRDLGNGMTVREIQQLPYPMFVKMDGDQLAASSITSALTGSVMHWASPVKADAKVGDDVHHVDALLRTTDNAWLSAETKVEPDLVKYPESGFASGKDAPADKKGRQVLAVAITGGFASGVTKPTAGTLDGKPANDGKPASTSRLLDHSPPDARVVVFGSSAFASDDVLQLAASLDSELASSNVELVHNAVDWSLADTDLLGIRAHNSSAHAMTIAADDRGVYRTINVVIGALALIAIAALSFLRQRAVKPILDGKEAA